MTTEQWLWILGLLVGALWWFFTDKLASLKSEYENGLNSLRGKSDVHQEQIQYLRVEVERRVTRDELNSLRIEIKNDFKTFKDELIEAIKELK